MGFNSAFKGLKKHILYLWDLQHKFFDTIPSQKMENVKRYFRKLNQHILDKFYTKTSTSLYILVSNIICIYVHFRVFPAYNS